jgi:hypothetical protein
MERSLAPRYKSIKMSKRTKSMFSSYGVTLTRIQNGRRRSDKRKHVKFLVKQTVYKDFMEENQLQKVNSKSIN